jgi:hypothetical protein
VLNGTEGVQDAVLGSIARGFTALQALRSSLAPSPAVPVAQNGRAETAPEEPPAPERIRRTGAPG